MKNQTEFGILTPKSPENCKCLIKYKKYGFKKTSKLPLHVEHVKFYHQQVFFNHLSKNSPTTHKCNIAFFYSYMT